MAKPDHASRDKQVKKVWNLGLEFGNCLPRLTWFGYLVLGNWSLFVSWDLKFRIYYLLNLEG